MERRCGSKFIGLLSWGGAGNIKSGSGVGRQGRTFEVCRGDKVILREFVIQLYLCQ